MTRHRLVTIALGLVLAALIRAATYVGNDQ